MGAFYERGPIVAAMKDFWSRVVSDFVGRFRSASQAAIRTCGGWPTDHSTKFALQSGYFVRIGSVSATVERVLPAKGRSRFS
jgi:hypothetical protein